MNETKKPKHIQNVCVFEECAHCGEVHCHHCHDKAVQDERVRLIDEIMKIHKVEFSGGEYDCIEEYNKHTSLISDVITFDEKGQQLTIPKEEAKKLRFAEKCWFCDELRALRKKAVAEAKKW
jgi:hypothetical protein